MTVRRKVKKSAITVVGFTLVPLGIILMPLPGPGTLVTVAGLAILATEYAWARAALDKTRTKAINGQKQLAASKLALSGQILTGLAFIALAIFFIVEPGIPFANVATSAAFIFGGVVLITSAIIARRLYGTQ